MPAKKLPILFAVPILVMLATGGVFQLLRDSYTAEARLAWHHVPLDTLTHEAALQYRDSLARPTEYSKVLRLLQSDTVLTLLGYHLAVIELRQDAPWGDDSPWQRVNHPAWRVDMQEVFQRCLQQHRTPLDTSRVADSLHLLLASLGCLPDQLRKHLIIRPIPGTAQIRLQADCHDPRRSVVMVNRLGQAFVRYWVARQTATLKTRIAALAQQQSEWEAVIRERQEALRLARERLYSGTGARDLMRMQERISALESSRLLIQERVHRLEDALDEQREPQGPVSVVRIQHVRPTEGSSHSLTQELRESMARLSLIEQELMILKQKLAEADSIELAAERAQLDAAAAAYRRVQADWEFHQNALAHVAELLTFTSTNRSRLPSPIASYSLIFMSGLASLLLWMLVLLQIGYLKWPANTLPTP
jgi:hypothetical protein